MIHERIKKEERKSKRVIWELKKIKGGGELGFVVIICFFFLMSQSDEEAIHRRIAPGPD